MTELIKQRTDTDCNLCCLAMALGITYEEMESCLTLADAPTLAKSGMSNPMEDRLLAVKGYVPEAHFRRLYPQSHLVQTHFLRHILWGRRAVLTVMSKNNNDGMHAIYWDGKALFDPTQKKAYEWHEVEINEILMFMEIK
jgi:hypothetical protein